MFKFWRKKKDLISLMEEHYEKKEITKRSLYGDVYKMNKSGILTLGSGIVCGISSIGFTVGMYVIGEKIFVGNPYRFADNALFLIAELGATALVSGWGTKELYHLTRRKYNLFKTNCQEYNEKIQKDLA